MKKIFLPQLAFLTKENIELGVDVFPVDFLATKKPFEMTYFNVAPGCKTPLDQHEVVECWILLKGYGSLFYNNEKISAQPHDIFLFDSFQCHQIENLSEEMLSICSIYWNPLCE